MILGINRKVILLTFSMILVFGLALGYYIIRYQTRILKLELTERTNVLMNNLSIISEYPVLIRDRETIVRLTKGVLSQKDIVFCRIEDISGDFFYEEGSIDTGSVSEHSTTIVTSKLAEELDEDLILGTSREVTEEIGMIYLGVSHAGLTQKLNKVKMVIAVTVLITIFTTCLTIYFLLKRILYRPVNQLVMATERISKGNLADRVPMETKDEIGVLAASFNKMTEDLLKTTVSRDYVENILRNMKESLLVVSPGGVIMTVNQNTLDLLGYTEDEVLNRPVDMIFEEAKDFFIWTGDVSLAKKAIIQNRETFYITKDNNKIPVLFSASVMLDLEGSIQGIICVAIDITERKKAEDRKKRITFITSFSRSCRDFVELQPVTELATKGLAEQLNIQRVSVWLLDDANNLVCQKLYEHPKGLFSEGTVLSGERYPDYIKAILSDFPVDAHNARTDPRTKEFLNDYLIPLNIYSMLDTPIKLKGKVSGVLCMEQTEHIRHWSRDEIDFANTITAQLSNAIDRITERKQKEEELKNYGILFDNISDLAYICDTEGNILFLNKIFEKLSGYRSEECIGKPFAPLFDGEDMTKAIDLYSRTLAGESPQKEIIFKDTGVLCEYKNLPLRNEKGEIIGVIGTARDITERKKTEEQIKASLKEKEVLLNEVNHRVKNNLQVIASLLDMSSMQTRNQETIELFADFRNRVTSMAFIHSQLYGSERFDEIDMERHIQELSGNLLNIYSKEKTIILDIKSANVYLPVTKAVPCALVLNELISNSLKHAYRDGQQGTISISVQQLNDGTTFLKVKDDGSGIPEGIDIERTKSLGLKLARNIVYKQLNGKINIIRNKGTEFTVEFKHSEEDS